MSITSSLSHKWEDGDLHPGLLSPSLASSHCLCLVAACLCSLRRISLAQYKDHASSDKDPDSIFLLLFFTQRHAFNRSQSQNLTL